MRIRTVLALSAALASAVACGSAASPPGAVNGAPIDAPDASAPDAAVTPAPTCAELAAKTATPGDDLAITEGGAVRGTKRGDTFAFLGIPYAAPPTGALRWKPPAPAACTPGIRDATAFGNACPQNVTGAVQGSEDCLFVNVWKPAHATGPLPVLVWIHGGAYVMGSGNAYAPGLAEGIYDGQALAESRNVVVVSLNYRLGPLGFLALPELAAEDAHGSSGDYGFLDQIAALRWVQTNIAAFGGDPQRVAIFGESAGAFSVCALVASPLTTGLFASAIMESGACEAPTLAARIDQHKPFLVRSGCASQSDVLGCLRAKLPSELLASEQASLFDPFYDQDDGTNRASMTYGATVDGWFLPGEPITQIANGAHQKVPMIVGSNADEMAFFLKQGTLPTCVQYAAMVYARFGARANDVLAAYPCLGFLTPTEAAIQLYTDLVFTCPTRRVARAAAKWKPVHRYWFTKTMVWSTQVVDRAYHTAEIPYVFGSFDAVPTGLPSSSDHALSSAMQGFWAAFAGSGNPNAPSLPTWAAYDPAEDDAIVLDETLGTTSAIHADRCNFWDSLRAN